MIRLSFRFILISFVLSILLYESVDSKRGGSSGGRGSSGSRSSSRGSSGSRSSSGGGYRSSSGSSGHSYGSGSRSSSSGGSYRSSSSGGGSYGGGGSSRSYGSPNYGSSGRGWSNRYHGNTFIVVRSHTYYRGGGYGTVYTSRSGSSAAPSTAPASTSESPTVTTEMIRRVLFPGKRPNKAIFNFDETSIRPMYDENGIQTNTIDNLQLLLKTLYPKKEEPQSNPTTKRPDFFEVADALLKKDALRNASLQAEKPSVTLPPNMHDMLNLLGESNKSQFLKDLEARQKESESESRPMIPYLADKLKEMEEQKNGRKKRDHEQLAKIGLTMMIPSDEIAHIKEEERPVLVGSISYFWGDENLPRGDNETDCVDFLPVNDAASFTICNVTSLIRCQKSLSEVIVIGKRPEDMHGYRKVDEKMIVKTANDTIAENFAWFCPPSDKCCEWECCSTEEKEHTEYDPPDQDFVFFIHAMGALAFLAVLISICCCCRHYATKQSKLNPQQREQQQVELQPLNTDDPMQWGASDYPKQQRPPPYQPRDDPKREGYGWSVTPSAPPM